MFWLIAQMLIWLLAAAAFGGLIGWALRSSRQSAATSDPVSPASAVNPESRVRTVELESQLKQEREELETVRGRLGEIGQAVVSNPGQEASVAWRNRYLESRVRFLEGKLADLENATAPEKPPEDVNDEPTRLRWRNRYLEGRVKYLEEELVRSERFQPATPPQPAPATPPSAPAPSAQGDVATLERPSTKPDTLDAPRNGQADDLKQIAGIGPKLEKMLNAVGIYHLDQIANWTPGEVEWMNAAISFRGRIERERWIAQAQALLAKKA